MAESIYLYERPFFVLDTARERDTYLLEYLSDTERTDEGSIYTLLLNFAVDHKLIEQSNGKMTGSLSQNLGSWEWIINWTNFRSLIDLNVYFKVLGSLSSDNHFPLSQIIDLHVRLGSLFHPKLLNTIANRVINSIKLIPHNSTDESPMTWDDIVIQMPFIWVIILLQVVIKSNTVKLS